jgi:ABC-type multidrug transport system fused ATPase/permease subunit
MTSVERVNEYIDIEKESVHHGVIKPRSKWPEKGEIEFKQVSFAYDPSSPTVLKNLTFRINAREKIGIVGRTGSGKSTIFETLLCTGSSSGSILIDGVPIKDLSLHDLRSRIAVISVSTWPE